MGSLDIEHRQTGHMIPFTDGWESICWETIKERKEVTNE